jgi:DNA mismatch repair ATPase MutS/predicted GIY-YIG superfamily endonuclease
MKRSLEEFMLPKPKKIKLQNLFKKSFYDQWLLDLKKQESIYLRDNCLQQICVNSYGISATKNERSFETWSVREKNKFPFCLLFIQVGDIFDLYGIDSIIGIEFADMKLHKYDMLRSSIPTLDLQISLDKLILLGFKCRIYIESKERGLNKRFKKRFISQVVCESNPIYFQSTKIIDRKETKKVKLICFVFKDSVLFINTNHFTFNLFEGLSSSSIMTLINSEEIGDIYVDKKYKIKNTKTHSMDNIQSIWKFVEQFYYLFKSDFKQSDFFKEPLLKSTSSQLGICLQSTIPNLLTSMLGKANISEKKFILDWILIKPSKSGRINMERLCEDIGFGRLLVSMNSILCPTKIHGLLLSNGICFNPMLFSKISKQMNSFHFNEHLINITNEYLGYKIPMNDFCSGMDILKSWFNDNLYKKKTYFGLIPDGFVSKNNFRVINHESIDKIDQLIDPLNQLLINYKKNNMNIVYNNVENKILLHSDKDVIPNYYIHFDRNRGRRKNCFMTTELNEIQNKLIHLMNISRRKQLIIIKKHSQFIKNNFSSVMRVFLHAQVIAKSVHSHLKTVTSKHWTKATITDTKTITITDMFPHWMNKEESQTNSITLKQGEVILLTAPNSFGKTTLIRSIMICCILAHSGLFVPGNITIGNIDKFHLRLGSSDRPEDNLSSFEAEIYDLKMMFPFNQQTLICLDELARSTSPDEAQAFTQAMIEHIKQKQSYGIVSTHIHSLTKSGLTTNKTLTNKFVLHNGICLNSMSLNIYKKFDIDFTIIQRTKELLNNNIVSFDSDENDPIKIGEHIIGKKSIYIPNGSLIPPLFSSTPCVYIMKESDNCYYIGESKNVVNRQIQHKSVRTGDMYIFPVKHKTESLKFETLIIRECIRKKINLSSISDGNHKL